MSAVRVNLLPPEVAQRARQRRIAGLVAGLLAAYLLLLGALYAVKLSQVGEARRTRDAAQSEVSRLTDQFATLQEYRTLQADRLARNDLLAAAMADEVGVARLLNELALVVPPASSLRTLALNLEQTADVVAAAPAPAPSVSPSPGATVAPTAAPIPVPTPSPTEPATIGELTYEGYTVEGYAPGVQALLAGVAQVPAVTDPFATAAQVEELGGTEVTAFTGLADVDERAYTRRYAEGLPTGIVP